MKLLNEYLKQEHGGESVNKSPIKECSFIWTQWLKSKIVNSLPTYEEFNKKDGNMTDTCIYNRLEGNKNITNKKDLFINLMQFYEDTDQDPNDHIPLTFLIENGVHDSTFVSFLDSIRNLSNQTISSDDSETSICKPTKLYWIIKPGENTNRGTGIKVCETVNQLKDYINKHHRKSYIIQKYISNPLLVEGRKFDIRCYGLFTSINGIK